MDRLRRFLGRHARTRLCTRARRPGLRSRPARHLLVHAIRAGLVLSRRRETRYSRTAWDRLVSPLSSTEREDVVHAYYERLSEKDVVRRRPDALAWSRWESALISVAGDPGGPAADPMRADALARLETHYFQHRGFFRSDGELLEQAHRFKHLPAVIVQGRYDVITPAKNGLEPRPRMAASEAPDDCRCGPCRRRAWHGRPRWCAPPMPLPNSSASRDPARCSERRH